MTDDMLRIVRDLQDPPVPTPAYKWVPVNLTKQQIDQLKANPLTCIKDQAEWFKFIGWLTYAWPVLVGEGENHGR